MDPLGMKNPLKGFLFIALFGLPVLSIFLLILLDGTLPCLAFPVLLPALIPTYRVSRRHLFSTKSLVTDKRDPILYLRSFFDDAEQDPVRSDKKTSEELMFDVLRPFGPVVAVGSPQSAKREGALFGATRIYLNNNWETEVEKLMKISQLTVIEAGNTQGVVTEMKMARRVVDPKCILISFLSKYDRVLSKYEYNGSEIGLGKDTFYPEFAAHFGSAFGVPAPVIDAATSFIYFDENWNVETISLRPEENGGFSGWKTFNPDAKPRYHLPYIKIWRAMMLILQLNGIIDVRAFNKEIKAAKIRFGKNEQAL